MKALACEAWDSLDAIRLVDLPIPAPRPDEVRLAVRACSLNGSDAEFVTGVPLYGKMMRRFLPEDRVLGSDVAGVIDAVGADVTGWSVGDEVIVDLFDRWGGLAEQVCAPAADLVAKPASLGFVEAAALPQAGVIAMQAIRDVLRVGPSDRALILGAGGGVGTFALQLAKSAGAHVTAVDGAAKLALLRELGADVALDYRVNDVAMRGERWDAILDIPGRRSVRALRRLLRPGGRYTIVGGHLRHVLGAMALGGIARLTGGDRHMGILAWEKTPENLAAAAGLAAEGRFAPVVDGPYPLAEGREAFRRLVEGTARGKVVVEVSTE